MITISSSSITSDSARTFAETKSSSLNREWSQSTSWTANILMMMRNPTVTTVIGIFPTAAAKFVAAPLCIERQAWKSQDNQGYTNWWVVQNDDSTVVTSNLSKNLKSRRPVAPRIATLPDDDPSCIMQTPSFASADDDIEDGDIYKEGRDDIVIMSSINAVDIHCLQLPMFKSKQLLTTLTMTQIGSEHKSTLEPT